AFFETKKMNDLNLKQSTGGKIGDMRATSQYLHLAGATQEELEDEVREHCPRPVDIPAFYKSTLVKR
ncbi:hypothetical protein HAX54_000948, partial [Datura stramonium]|nr:hypothetical protein [Datura stramonium]